MKPLRTLYGCLVAIFLITSFLPAQSREGEETMELSVDQAVDLGLKYSKSLRTSADKVEGAQAKARENDTYGRPSLTFKNTYTRLSRVPPFEITLPSLGTFVINPSLLNVYNFQMTLQQPLFTGFQLSSLSKLGHLQAQAAVEEYRRDESELVFAVRDAYWTVYKAIAVKRLVDENVSLIEAHMNDVRNFCAQGLAKQNDVLKVQVQLSNAQVTQLQAANAIKLAVMALNSLIGLPVNGDIRITSTVSESGGGLPQPLDALVSRALERRPDLKAVDFQIKAAQAGVKAAKSARYPQVFLVANYYMSRPNERIMPVEDRFTDTWDVSLALSYDLWNWNRAGHQTSQAKAQLAQAENGAAQLRDGIVLEVSQNYFALEQQKLAIKLAADTVVQAEENYRVTRDRFKAGLALNSDLLDAEVALLQAKISYSQVLVDREVLQAKLEKSVYSKGR
jgi:outer membrane protein